MIVVYCSVAKTVVVDCSIAKTGVAYCSIAKTGMDYCTHTSISSVANLVRFFKFYSG